jgi:RIO kinase 1
LSTSRSDDDSRYDQLASKYDPAHEERRARKHKPNHKPKRSDTEIRGGVAGSDDASDDSFKMTYKAARYEEPFLIESLKPFFEQTLITDVMAAVKGGKEASVYRCLANPTTGHEWLAAKVYRPRMMRNLRNDAIYREGREYVGTNGAIHENDKRDMRAIRKKTSFGVGLQHQSWLAYEYNTLDMLYRAGASVPQPISLAENAILMGYIGDRYTPAPVLESVDLEEMEGISILDEVIRNVELLLVNGWIHGDLSAFNILYWQGKVTLIDFPQVTSAHKNRSALAILSRDIQRVCEYFIQQGVNCNPEAITRRLWKKYIDRYPNERYADQSWLEPQER